VRAASPGSTVGAGAGVGPDPFWESSPSVGPWVGAQSCPSVPMVLFPATSPSPTTVVALGY
jgi:hypothetical protein